ncbi:MAG: Excinuclease subunit domain protein [Candidatus Peribacteria bacterium]|nr:Excinuclease subunit domain protein [Candidatus Peribacteria bacterium]
MHQTLPMWYFVYILRSSKGEQYVGYTKKLNARLRQHNEGSVIATKNKRPWGIEWFCGFKTEKQAVAFEKHLKTGSGSAIRFRHLAPKEVNGYQPIFE